MVLTLQGQIRGGKNNVQITRTGHRYPLPAFEKWRNEAVAQIHRQIATSIRRSGKTMMTMAATEPFLTRCEASIDYTPGDLKVRDVPAMMDALWSVLVKAGVLADDGLIRNVTWREHPLDRTGAMVRITLEKL